PRPGTPMRFVKRQAHAKSSFVRARRQRSRRLLMPARGMIARGLPFVAYCLGASFLMAAGSLVAPGLTAAVRVSAGFGVQKATSYLANSGAGRLILGFI